MLTKQTSRKNVLHNNDEQRPEAMVIKALKDSNDKKTTKDNVNSTANNAFQKWREKIHWKLDKGIPLSEEEAKFEAHAFNQDWAPIIIRANRDRFMDPHRIQQLLPKLKGHIGKLVQEDAGMKRVVRPVYCKHTEQPKVVGMPFTVCFNYSGFSLTHAEVKGAVDTKLEHMAGQYSINAIVFIPLASQLSLKNMDNRWLVSFNKNEAKLDLIRFGLKLRGQYVTVRDYSDVQRVELAIWQLLNPDKCENLLATDSRPETGRMSTASSGTGGSETDKVKKLLNSRRPTFAELRCFLGSK